MTDKTRTPEQRIERIEQYDRILDRYRANPKSDPRLIRAIEEARINELFLVPELAEAEFYAILEAEDHRWDS